jgi:hypothetical protein
MLRVRIWPVLCEGRGDSIFTLARVADDVKRDPEDSELSSHPFAPVRYGTVITG